jgi:hypothetical protein
VSTFYLLPSRPFVGERFSEHLKTLFPGLEWGSSSWGDLADALCAAATGRPEVYVVYRDELPDGEDPARGLADGFGAERGDEVIEVCPGSRPGEITARRRLLTA